jgi:ribosomal protein S8
MAHSNQTIHDMFNALQNRFGAFLEFEDVPASVLNAEIASEARFDDLTNIAQEAVA